MYYKTKSRIAFQLATIFVGSSALGWLGVAVLAFTGHPVAAILCAAIAAFLTLPARVAITDYRYYRDRANQDEETRRRISRQ